MKELKLDDIKRIEYSLLCHFKEFCQTNEIDFFLSNGTLLGAVKYKGFIPWDDDVDVLVPRKDYDKLLEIYEDADNVKLFAEERNENYKFTFAKLCDMTTIKKEYNIDNGIQLGVDIDIFPLDSCTSHILKKSIFRRIKFYQMGCILSKFQCTKGRGFVKGLIINYCRIKGHKYFSKKLKSLIKKEANRGHTKKGCLMWPIYGEKEVVSSNVFDKHIMVRFEEDYFPAPNGYHVYLSSLYGDYKKDPPTDKQKTHHKFVAYQVDFDCL